MTVSADPAIPVLQKLVSCEYEAATIQVIISGASSSCSQKIHNVQRGILEASQDSKYVICLDDDVQLHPGFLQRAVEHMEADPSAFMLTGQPLPLLPPSHQLSRPSVHLPLPIPRPFPAYPSPLRWASNGTHRLLPLTLISCCNYEGL